MTFSDASSRLTLGLIINPLAGIGGAVGLKGSDGFETACKALSLGAEKKANARTRTALGVLLEHRGACQFITCPGDMGADVLADMGFQYRCLSRTGTGNRQPSNSVAERTALTRPPLTSSEDTRQAARQMMAQGVDVLLFAGGDGTARDICSVVTDETLVLGIPAGVKIHSGVFGVTPTATGEVIKRLLDGQLVDITEAEVRDLDEDAFRQGQVRARHYGELRVPQQGHFVQAVKQGGIEDETLAVADIAAWVVETLEGDCLYLVGSGKTTLAVMDEIGLPGTLLGVDAVLDGQLIQSDLAESDIWALLEQYPQSRVILSVMGGQGHILGRGNQQFSPRILRRIGQNRVQLISTKSKLNGLSGRPLIVDSGDAELDAQWAGVMEVTTGYRDQVAYPVA